MNIINVTSFPVRLARFAGTVCDTGWLDTGMAPPRTDGPSVRRETISHTTTITSVCVCVCACVCVCVCVNLQLRSQSTGDLYWRLALSLSPHSPLSSS